MMYQDKLALLFSSRVRDWAKKVGATAEQQASAGQAAIWVSQAIQEGHTCYQLTEDQNLSQSDLLKSGVVGTPEARGSYPLILDHAQRLYLHRYFDYEVRLARRLAVASLPLHTSESDLQFKSALNTFFVRSSEPQDTEVDWQQCAAALALLQRFVVVSGGPGTGKTTMVVNLLACLLSQNPNTRIVLAAPTGKAAARMLEALRKRAAALPESIRSGLPRSASTVHRLLGTHPQRHGFVHDSTHRLMLDVLVVDEASMLDLSLATHLLEAVPDHARVILLGDKDQLSAVESGAVFAELSSKNQLSPSMIQRLADLMNTPTSKLQHLCVKEDQSSVIADSVVWFTRQHRFSEDSAIGRVANHLRLGDEEAVIALLKAPGCCELGLQWRIPAAKVHRPGADELDPLFAGFADYFSIVRGASYQAAQSVLEAFDRFRVLCAVRRGPWGAEQLAHQIETKARALLLPPEEMGFESAWYVGRPVMIVRNDPQLKLFNGDIGITLVGPDGELQVCFPPLEEVERRYAPVRLPVHETAYAMTIHKSQGSELDHVAVVFPQEPSQVITRELLYTGITRAKQSVLLISSEKSLRQAIQTPTRRSSGLLTRMSEASIFSESP